MTPTIPLNKPTFAEVQAMWRAECERFLPKWLRRLGVLMPLVGCLFFAYNLTAALSPTSVPVSSDITPHDIVFIIGFLLICLPLLYLPWVWLMLPPAPTPDNYLKTLQWFRNHQHHHGHSA